MGEEWDAKAAPKESKTQLFIRPIKVISCTLLCSLNMYIVKLHYSMFSICSIGNCYRTSKPRISIHCDHLKLTMVVNSSAACLARALTASFSFVTCNDHIEWKAFNHKLWSCKAAALKWRWSNCFSYQLLSWKQGFQESFETVNFWKCDVIPKVRICSIKCIYMNRIFQ